VDKDDTTLEDLPELPEILGGLVLDKNADEMNYYLDNGEFPSEDEEPTRRRETRQSESREERPTGRRTPANTGGRGDRF
jgi:hypothetical protein